MNEDKKSIKEKLFNQMMMCFSELEQGEITEEEMVDTLIKIYKDEKNRA